MDEDEIRALLDFEKLHWKFVGSKENAIRERFGLSLTNYYQLLNRAIDTREALEMEPALVLRLRSKRRSTLGR